MVKINYSQILADELVKFGVTDIFAVSGGPISGLLEAFSENPKLSIHYLLHEQSAGIAAEAYAANDLKPVVVLVTSGPGATNALTPLAASWTNSTPVIFISGQVRQIDIENKGTNRQWGSQHVDPLPLVKTLTKQTLRINPQTTHEEISSILSLTTSGRMGPVWFEVPQDVQRLKYDPGEVKKVFESETIPANNLDYFLERLIGNAKSCQRPLLLLGNGIRSSWDKYKPLVEKLGWPIQTTWPALDLLESDNPLYAGRNGSIATWFANLTLQSADLLLILGARLDLGQTAFRPENFAKNAAIYRIDVDSEEFRRLPNEKSLNLHADLRQFVDIFELFVSKQKNKVDINYWLNEIKDLKENLSFCGNGEFSEISMYSLIDVVGQNLEKFPTIVSGSSGTCTEQLMQAIEIKGKLRVQNSGGLGSMGFGIAGGIGAAIATQRPVLVMESDGSFAMNIQDLEFIARNELPIKIIIMDSRGYKSIYLSQNRIGQKITGANEQSGVHLPNSELVASSMGIPSLTCYKTDNWEKCISDFLSTTSPGLLRVIVDSEEEALPRVISKPNEKGQMVTSEMENLYPPLSEEIRMKYWPKYFK